MKIIKIQFSSAKIYQYLLDYKKGIVPNKGDVLYNYTGIGKFGAHKTELNVVGIEDTDMLPAIVTTMLRVHDDGKECEVFRLSAATLERLRTRKPIPSKTTASPSDFKPYYTADGRFDVATTLFYNLFKGGK